MRKNRRVNLKKLTKEATFDGSPVLDVIRSDFRAWVKLGNDTFIDRDGEFYSSDGEIRFEPQIEIRIGEDSNERYVIEVHPDITKRYRLEQIKEGVNATGRVIYRSAILVRDIAIED